MSSLEDLMNERRRLQKELDKKSSLDEYKKKLAATIGLAGAPSVPVATPSLPLVDNLFPAHSSVPSTDANDEMITVDLMDDSVPVMARETTTAIPSVDTVPATPTGVYNTEIETTDVKTSSSEVPTFTDLFPSEMATSTSKQMATPITSPSTVVPDLPSKPSLKEIQDRVHKERGLMFEDRPIPVDPEDSRRLATPLPRAKSRGSSFHRTSPPSADLVALQRDMAEKRNSWMAQLEADELAKKKSWATLAYEESQKNSPFPVPIPSMPDYHSLVNSPLATNPTLQLPLDAVSGITERTSASLVIDMGTERGMAITIGLVGAGM
jgi:hypothetical protein